MGRLGARRTRQLRQCICYIDDKEWDGKVLQTETNNEVRAWEELSGRPEWGNHKWRQGTHVYGFRWQKKSRNKITKQPAKADVTPEWHRGCLGHCWRDTYSGNLSENPLETPNQLRSTCDFRLGISCSGVEGWVCRDLQTRKRIIQLFLLTEKRQKSWIFSHSDIVQ